MPDSQPTPKFNEEVANFFNSNFGQYILENHVESKGKELIRKRWLLYVIPISIISGAALLFGLKLTLDVNSYQKKVSEYSETLESLQNKTLDYERGLSNKIEEVDKKLKQVDDQLNTVILFASLTRDTEGAIATQQNALLGLSNDVLKNLISSINQKTDGIKDEMKLVTVAHGQISLLSDSLDEMKTDLDKWREDQKSSFESGLKSAQDNLKANEIFKEIKTVRKEIEEARKGLQLQEHSVLVDQGFNRLFLPDYNIWILAKVTHNNRNKKTITLKIPDLEKETELIFTRDNNERPFTTHQLKIDVLNDDEENGVYYQLDLKMYTRKEGLLILTRYGDSNATVARE